MIWDTQAQQRKRAIELSAMAFAVGGLAVLGLVAFSGRTPASAEARPPLPAAVSHGSPAVPVAHPAPPLEAEPAAPPQPPATRGPQAIVRWRGPLSEGLALLDAGRADQALAWARKHGPAPADGVKAVEARALLALGRLPDARGRFAELFHAGTNAEARADGRLGLALCAANGNLQAAALEELQALAGGESPGWGAAVAAFGWAGALDSGKAPGLASADEHARAAYQKALTSDALPAELERICQARLEALTEKIVLSPARRHALGAPKAVFHAVEPGQSLYQIARQHGVSIGQLCRLNQLDRNGFLRVGQTLKVLPGEARLVVDRWRLTATLFCDGAYLRRWPVGIGPGEATPSGRFTIRTKLVNPDWYYGGKKIPFGNPENVLGTRWLGFDREEAGGKGAGIGVHGTTIPESVPGRESKGCVRMHNASVEELYDWLPQGGTVVIN